MISLWVKGELVFLLLCHCPLWKPPGAGRRKASPQFEAEPRGEKEAEKVTFEADNSAFSFFKRDSLVSITWWSLSFSSYMILCTSLLLSFFTICTSAAVDKSWSKNTNERVYVKITDWYMIATLELWGKWMLLHTWTRLSVSRRKLKSPNTKKGSTVCRMSDILEK